MDENKLMLLFLSKKLGTNDPKKILKYLKGLDKQKLLALAQEYQLWKESLKTQQAQKAAHGAKLQYIKSLKHICPEGEELVYYKKGGSVTCGCKKKKEQGGEIVKNEPGGIVSKFKKKGESVARKITDTIATITGTKSGVDKAREAKEKELHNTVGDGTSKSHRFDVKPKFKNDYSSKRVKDSEKDYLEGRGDHLYKNGSKLKSAGCGCSVKKFKAKCGSKLKKHLLGGSLNGIPFYLGGTPKGGIVLPEYMYKKQIGYPSILPGRYTGLEKITPGLFLMFKTWVKGLPKSLSTSDKVAIGTGTVLGNVLGYDDTHNLNIRKTANKIANKVSPLIESSIEYRPFSADRLIESTLKPKKPSFKEFKK